MKAYTHNTNTQQLRLNALPWDAQEQLGWREPTTAWDESEITACCSLAELNAS